MKKRYPVISLMQPWATLVVLGIKEYETRSQYRKFRGFTLIHASSWNAAGKALYESEAFQNAFGNRLRTLGYFSQEDFLQGKIIGSCEIEWGGKSIKHHDSIGIQVNDEIQNGGSYVALVGEHLISRNSNQLLLGDFSPGRMIYSLGKPDFLINPIPARGQVLFPWYTILKEEQLEMAYEKMERQLSQSGFNTDLSKEGQAIRKNIERIKAFFRKNEVEVRIAEVLSANAYHHQYIIECIGREISRYTLENRKTAHYFERYMNTVLQVFGLPESTSNRLAYIVSITPDFVICRECGCSDINHNIKVISWAEEDLCSGCTPEAIATRNALAAAQFNQDIEEASNG